ncbi:MAG: sulfotransferase [Miltoncostaeaceae bacterium]
MSQPNFFIVGAPKCGTTALSEYLRGHPQVFVSQPKEPHYFSSDFDYYYAPGQRRLDHYLRLFDDAGDQHAAVGEASVWYLYSREAAAGIHDFDGDARVVAMVRNPVDMVPSLHSQMSYMLDETEPDAEAAWRMQERRAEGVDVPESCRVPEFLQYGEAAKLGAQTRRLLEVIPREQVRIIVFDDLRRDAGAVYADTLDFLGVPDDGRREFAPVNQNKTHRARWVAAITQRPPRPLVAAASGVKKGLRLERLGVLDRVRDRNRVVARRPAISQEFRNELAAHFRQDVEELSELLGRDLGAWTEPVPESNGLHGP